MHLYFLNDISLGVYTVVQCLCGCENTQGSDSHLAYADRFLYVTELKRNG